MNKDKLELQSEFEQHKKAALNGSALDMWYVGQYYEHGQIGSKNLKEAIWWYERSAAHGEYLAMHNLGCKYKYGYGVKRNYSKAVEYFNDAIQHEAYILAPVELAELYQKGKGVLRNPRKAIELYELASEHGNTTVRLYIALAYLQGRGVEFNFEKGMDYLEATPNKFKEKNKILPLLKNLKRPDRTTVVKIIKSAKIPSMRKLKFKYIYTV